MSSPVLVAKVSWRVEDAAAALARHGFTAMPVVDDDDRLVGIVSEADVVLDPMTSRPGPTSSTVAGVPDPVQALEVLFGTRGLFVFAPILLLGLGGLVALARRPGPERRDAVVGLLVFVAYLGLQAGWVNPWGGEMPGPRYVIPAIPML
ncbi:MAG: CBS domain-containing protein, partial [Acidimicrobiales bacterium]|nr:CBS domain-containing protein [Acidimicrobiales bacterium]